MRPVDRAVKRTVDVVVAAGTLVLTAPLFAGAAAAVRISMGSPVLFRQDRPGLGGRTFTILKLRTMRLGEGSDAERLTRTGRVLRRFSLDELPQLLNVLRGDMSLVGPRPLRVEYLPLYDARQARRHEVRPGITGLAQVSGRNAVSWAERLELDVQYVERARPALDAAILWRTVRGVIAGEGISADGEATMTPFTGSGGGGADEVGPGEGR